eukprot:6658664-Pyramimonas_sp.AAC.2
MSDEIGQNEHGVHPLEDALKKKTCAGRTGAHFGGAPDGLHCRQCDREYGGAARGGRAEGGVPSDAQHYRGGEHAKGAARQPQPGEAAGGGRGARQRRQHALPRH